MKLNLRSICFLSFALLLFACNKDNISSNDINPLTEPSAFSRALLINNATNIGGDLPDLKSSSGLDILNSQSHATVSVNNFMFLPFIYDAGGSPEGLFLQVDGADNYWEILFEPDTVVGRAPKVVSVGIPENIMQGDAVFNYQIFGDQGVSSGRIKSISVEIELPEVYCIDGRTVGTIEGEDGITNKTFQLGTTPGFISIDFDTYSVPDRVDIRYNNQWIRSTGELLSNLRPEPPIKECNQVVPGDGFLGIDGNFNMFYDPAVSDKVTVYMSGCLDGGTAWNFRILECPKELPILGIHSNVQPDDPKLTSGHAWVSLTQDGTTTMYGLWPDMHGSTVDNGSDSDVRINLEKGFGAFSRYYPVDEQELIKFNNYISINHTWEYTNNCSSFAQALVDYVIDEDIPADEVFTGSFIETPRKLSKGINEFEMNYPTASYRPVNIPEDNSSCSFCF